MTFVVASNDGKGSVIRRSVLRSATDPKSQNLHADKEASVTDIVEDIPNIDPDFPTTDNTAPIVDNNPIESRPRRSPRSHPTTSATVEHPLGTKISKRISGKQRTGQVTS